MTKGVKQRQVIADLQCAEANERRGLQTAREDPPAVANPSAAAKLRGAAVRPEYLGQATGGERGMALIDVTVTGTPQGNIASVWLVTSTRFIDLTASAWTNDTVRMVARNISGATFDLAAATLSVGVTKRRVP